jgi:XTP/dITP diphosphohydrolase/tetrapyrrole methylase family protein/MazG family protein/ATP diphosphatase
MRATARRRRLLAIQGLDEITRRLRTECPWDREQDERSIVPHTVEEAYELADAALAGDDAKLLDELGDVLFQVLFLSLLLEERGAGDLAAVAEGCREKLIRRHPHVFGDAVAETPDKVLRNWDSIKAEREGGGLFGDLPETLPATLRAKKVLRRARRAEGARVEPASLSAAVGDPFEAVGDLLLAAVARAAEEGVDPELALRAATDRHVNRVEEAL